MLTKYKAGWDDVRRWVYSLKEQLRLDEFQPDIIIGISRGGLIPAVMLSHQLGVSPLLTIQLTSYARDHSQSQVKLLHGDLPILPASKKILVVDDICDTGASIKFIRTWANTFTNSNYFRTACLVTKMDTAQHMPEYSGMGWSGLEWIEFPWEREYTN